MARFLVIQTAFIGDAILATALLEKLHQYFPDDSIDLMVRRGNEPLFSRHPYLNKVHVWDKTTGKYRHLWALIRTVRAQRYECIINLQRFFSTGLLTLLSGARQRIGFCDNPFSFAYHFKIPYSVDSGLHEVQRNQKLIESMTDAAPSRPVLYPSKADIEKTAPLKGRPYVCLAPASVWPTKKLPEEKWIELSRALCERFALFFIGAPDDRRLCDRMMAALPGGTAARNLCGELSLLQSAALMQDARMNYVNDSAPLHLASGVNAPTTAFFCSTVPDFGFGPLAEVAVAAQTEEALDCRPCGIHGRKKCPEGHFRCGHGIDVKRYLLL